MFPNSVLMLLESADIAAVVARPMSAASSAYSMRSWPSVSRTKRLIRFFNVSPMAGIGVRNHRMWH